MPAEPNARVEKVDLSGIRAASDHEVVLDVAFDGRRIWSFHLHRDGRADETAYEVPWPRALRRFLDGTTRLTVSEHIGRTVLFDERVRLGDSDQPIAVVDEDGRPLAGDKALRLVQMFESRTQEDVAPLIDAVTGVLALLSEHGIEAFAVYGTLLGAVREGRLIGHDSDADLGYLSEHQHPVDVMRESYRLQRLLVEHGYRTRRYGGGSFKIMVDEPDGSVRGLDLFAGFFMDGFLHLLGELRVPYERSWILPSSTATLEGRPVPVPADPERFLATTYGPDWRTPDPAFHFDPPPSTSRRLTGWFRGTGVRRGAWAAHYQELATEPAPTDPSAFARWVAEQEGGAPARLVDLGCGRAGDDLWFARQGSRVVGFDYVDAAGVAVATLAAAEGLDLELRRLTFGELRPVLTQSALLAHEPGPRTVTARHLVDAVDPASRDRLWRACRMLLAGGGRLYAELVTRRARGGGQVPDYAPVEDDPDMRLLHPVRLRVVEAELRAHGARVLSTESRRTRSLVVSRIVAAWAAA